MTLKTFKPYTKSTRGTVLVDRANLWKGKPYKPLTSINNASKGRNNYGRITSRNKGGGHKQKYRVVNFYRKKKKFYSPRGIVCNFEKRRKKVRCI